MLPFHLTFKIIIQNNFTFCMYFIPSQHILGCEGYRHFSDTWFQSFLFGTLTILIIQSCDLCMPMLSSDFCIYIVYFLTDTYYSSLLSFIFAENLTSTFGPCTIFLSSWI